MPANDKEGVRKDHPGGSLCNRMHGAKSQLYLPPEKCTQYEYNLYRTGYK